MSPKVIVTGGAGYIGSHTVVALAEAGYEPVIVDNFCRSDREVPERIGRIIGRDLSVHDVDCCSLADLARVFAREGDDIAGVVHFAAYKSVGESVREPSLYYANNVGSTATLLQAMEAAEVRDLVFSSSCTVYGQPETLPVTETCPWLPPASPYGHTKQICEAMLEDAVAAGKSLRAVPLRYFNPIGAHPSARIGELPIGVPDNLVPFITQTAAGLRETLTVFGDDYPTRDGSCVRDYIHVSDLADAHVKALEWLARSSSPRLVEVFNVGTGEGSTVLEVIAAFESTADHALPHEIGPRRPGDVAEVYADVSKAERNLRWRARRNLRDSMRDAWHWQRSLEA